MTFMPEDADRPDGAPRTKVEFKTISRTRVEGAPVDLDMNRRARSLLDTMDGWEVNNWSPLSEEDKEIIAYLRLLCAREAYRTPVSVMIRQNPMTRTTEYAFNTKIPEPHEIEPR